MGRRTGPHGGRWSACWQHRSNNKPAVHEACGTSPASRTRAFRVNAIDSSFSIAKNYDDVQSLSLISYHCGNAIGPFGRCESGCAGLRTALLASAMGLHGLLGMKHRPGCTPLRAVKPVSEGLQMPSGQVVKTNRMRGLNRCLIGALVLSMGWRRDDSHWLSPLGTCG